MATSQFAHGGPVLGTGEFMLGFFEIAYASGTPTISVDTDNLTSAVADTATGKITVTMTHRYKALRAFVNGESSGGLAIANAGTITDGLAADNTILVTVASAATGALADLDGTYTVMVIGRQFV